MRYRSKILLTINFSNHIFWFMTRLNSKLMRAARALAGWEQSDLAEAAGISIATVRKIEQGASGTRPRTESEIIAAFERAGVLLIADGPDGGAGVRWKEREMNEEIRKYVDLKNKIKGWFIYNLGHEDDERLDGKITDVSFQLSSNDPAHWEEILTRSALPNLPAPLVTDLNKLGEIEEDIDVQEMIEWEEAQKNEDEDEGQDKDKDKDKDEG
jgi:transcriptional regulator with XRE-family HTH domain